MPTRAQAAAASRLDLRPAFVAGLLIAGAVLVASPVRGQEVTTSWSYSSFGNVKYSEDLTHLDYVNPDAPKGGEISIWAQGSFDSFNNYARDGVSAALSSIGDESILTSTSDDPYGLYCFMCTSMEYPADISYVTFNLRDDVNFADGSPMTAEDVAFSFNLFQTQGIAEYRNIVQGFIESVDVEGPYRITFRFTDQAPLRDRIGFAGGTAVFSKKWFEETGTRLDKSIQQLFMSTGPYVLDSFDINRRIVYKRNPNYWGADLPINKGRNNFDRIRVEYFADSDAALEGFKAGAYTFRTETSSQDWAESYDFPAIEKGWVVREEIPDGEVGTHLSWVFNLDREKWQDLRVRRAIGLMFNFEWSNKTLFYDLYARPLSYWPNTDLAATGTPSPEEVALLQPLVDQGLLDASILTDEVVPWPENDPAQNRPARSVLRQANALLDEAGWEIGSDGIRRNDKGETLDVNIIQFNPLYDRIVNPFIENLELIGVRGQLDRIDTSQYVERRRKGDFDLANQGFAMNFEPSIGLEQWFASKTADDSSRNLMRLRNPGVDEVIKTVIAASSFEELTTAVHALDRVLRAVGFDIPLWYNDETWVAYYDMYRHPTAGQTPLLATGELDFWWYDAEAGDRLRAAGAF